MENLSDVLLDAWLKATSVLINHRMVEGLSFNEAFVCNLLNRSENRTAEKKMTATYLCRETGMLKSQMNKTLNALEKKGMIRRERSISDRRKVYIHLVEENMELYWRSHQEVLAFIECLVAVVGRKTAEETAEILSAMAGVIREIEKGEGGWQYNPK